MFENLDGEFAELPHVALRRFCTFYVGRIRPPRGMGFLIVVIGLLMVGTDHFGEEDQGCLQAIEAIITPALEAWC